MKCIKMDFLVSPLTQFLYKFEVRNDKTFMGHKKRKEKWGKKSTYNNNV